MVVDRLTEFLREAAAREFRLGTWDCGLWLADWYMAATGKPDPAAHLRGAEYSADELSRHVLPVIAALGLRQTRDPAAGDIAIIRFYGRDTGAICSGKYWMVIGRGMKALPMPGSVVKAWKVV